MDQEQSAWPTPEELKKKEEEEARARRAKDREKKKAELAARIAEQKRTGRKQKKAPVVDVEGFTEVTRESGQKTAKGKPTRGRSIESTGSNRSRGASVPASKKKPSGSKKAARGSSVDSGISKMSTDSKSTTSSPKRKKSATFAAGVPNNEGKTASLKKQQKVNKEKDSYAKKAGKSKKTTWVYEKIIKFSMKFGRCKNPCIEVYDRHKKMMDILQSCDQTCAIADYINRKSPPLYSPGEFPREKEHGRYQRYFTLDDEQDWSWDPIGDGQSRTFTGSFILLSDKEPEELFRWIKVDLRQSVDAVYCIKEIQEMYTILSCAALGVHANCDPGNVAYDLRCKLWNVEKDILERKKEWYETADGFYEPIFDEIKEDWSKVPFPDILGIRSYPKGGPYEKSKRGVDTSWKLAIHFEWAARHEERILFSMSEFKRNGGVEKLFGDQAILKDLIHDPKDVAGKAEFVGLLPKHQNTNRSVGSVFLPGVIDVDTEFPIYFEEYKAGATRTPKWMSLRDVLRKVYVKIGDRKFSVFQYCFRTRGGTFQAWFWDTVPDIRDFVNTYASHIGSYLWHRLRLWGWETKSMKRLFEGSFDSDTAIAAMNSKWNEKKKKVIEVAIGSEAAQFMKFGSSPFILATGETALKRPPSKKAKISRSNLGPDQTGGIDIEDLESVSGESHAETVFHGKVSDEEMSEEDDDDVSAMDENEGFEDDDDESTKAGAAMELDDESEAESEDGDESTKAGAYRGQNTVETSEEEDSADARSAGESTKADLDDLKMKGKKVREDPEENETIDQLKTLIAAQAKMMSEMNMKLAALESEKKNASNPGPGTTEGGNTTGENSGVASEGGEPAAQV